MAKPIQNIRACHRTMCKVLEEKGKRLKQWCSQGFVNSKGGNDGLKHTRYMKQLNAYSSKINKLVLMLDFSEKDLSSLLDSKIKFLMTDFRSDGVEYQSIELEYDVFLPEERQVILKAYELGEEQSAPTLFSLLTGSERKVGAIKQVPEFGPAMNSEGSSEHSESTGSDDQSVSASPPKKPSRKDIVPTLDGYKPHPVVPPLALDTLSPAAKRPSGFHPPNAPSMQEAPMRAGSKKSTPRPPLDAKHSASPLKVKAAVARPPQPGVRLGASNCQGFALLSAQLDGYITRRQQDNRNYYRGAFFSKLFGGFSKQQKIKAASALRDLKSPALFSEEHLEVLREGKLGRIVRAWEDRYRVSIDAFCDKSKSATPKRSWF